jgi:LppX_LprAFG lipoprotein
MSLQKTLVGAIAVVATLTVAGCGSAVDISGSQSASLSKSSFATALTDATSQAKSVHVTGTVKAQGQTITLTADESFGDRTLKGMSGDVTVVLPAMGSVEARIVGGVVYINGSQLPLGQASGKPWVKIDLTDTSNPVGSMLSQITDTVGPGQITDLLKGLSTVTTVGPETVDGVATTHYKVSVDTSKLGSTLGLDPSQLDGAALPKTVTYDVWLDSASRPVKLSMATTAFSLDLHFSKWGEPVHVVAPPASQVSSAGF